MAYLQPRQSCKNEKHCRRTQPAKRNQAGNLFIKYMPMSPTNHSPTNSGPTHQANRHNTNANLCGPCNQCLLRTQRHDSFICMVNEFIHNHDVSMSPTKRTQENTILHTWPMGKIIHMINPGKFVWRQHQPITQQTKDFPKNHDGGGPGELKGCCSESQT